jgi:hypothetical protein
VSNEVALSFAPDDSHTLMKLFFSKIDFSLSLWWQILQWHWNAHQPSIFSTFYNWNVYLHIVNNKFTQFTVFFYGI